MVIWKHNNYQLYLANPLLSGLRYQGTDVGKVCNKYMGSTIFNCFSHNLLMVAHFKTNIGSESYKTYVVTIMKFLLSKALYGEDKSSLSQACSI